MIKNKLIPSNTFALFTLSITMFISLSLNESSAQRSDITNNNVLRNDGISKQEAAPEIQDHKIISSTESYLELELYPQFDKNYDFKNSASSTEKKGSPDVKMRSFPIYLPVTSNNRVEILDEKYEDVQNVELNPVPTSKLGKDKDLMPEYIKDEKAFSINKLLPGTSAEVVNAGALRNKYFGFLNIYPAQYNPVTNTLRKYSYIRVRVVFGGNPVYQIKPLNIQEKQFFLGAAINSGAAERWSTTEFNSLGDHMVINSVLAGGDYYKIEVRESGMFRMDRNFLQSNSINIGNADPRTIKIYGNGGGELPYNNAEVSPTDLVENKIFVAGEDDGRFDDNDYIIFYGRSPNEWRYDTIARSYAHSLNHFATSNYYFITFGGTNGQRMTSANSVNQPGINPVSSFRERFFEEPELSNLGSTGYLWLSQRINLNESFTFNKELKGYVDGSLVNFRFRFGNGASPANYWRLEDLNSNFLTTQYVPGISGFSHINLSYIGETFHGVNYPLQAGKRNINFKASLPSQNGNTANVAGYYDYYEVQYDRFFSADNNQLRFNSPDTNATVEYRINNFTTADIKLFEVTHQENVNIINPISFANGTVVFQYLLSKDSPKEFYVVGGNNFKTPSSVSAKIANQNLKGDFADGASFLIISPKEFLSAANRLKAHREVPGAGYLKTFVIDVEKIYNEFSGGLPDPVAVRNFLKFTYKNWDQRPFYVLFMGDGSYDYKNIYLLYSNGIRNWILPIERDSEFANDVDSYCSDDYIVEINENNSQPSVDNTPDFASGRLCVNSLVEANNVVDKIIAYEDPQNFDKWRNLNMYVADDGWTTDNTGGQEGSLHTDQCEDVAQNHTPAHVKKEKIYIVSYPSEFTPQGRRKPGANSDIIKGWNDGRLVINYTGHGSVDLWAHEHVFVRQVSIPQLNNKNKYPFVTIASCDLARWDDPYLISAGEQLVNLKDKGAIGVSAAVRPVYALPNATYNNKFYDNMYKKEDLNFPLRLGLVMFNVKQTLHGDNDLKFALICDPTLRLGVPQYFSKVDSINNTPATEVFNMKALQKIKISGSILRPDSTFWGDYNGKIDLTVLDVDKNISVIDFGFTFNYKQDGGIIYSGKANVVNGKWTTDFVVPRDISYSPGRGKIIGYFQNNFSDGVAYSNNFIMSGLDSTALADSTGPVINIFMDNRNFRSGDMVNQNPKLIADFSDQSGMNLTGTIGHKIEAVLNDDANNKIDLTALYTSASGFQDGSVEYQMENLADGKYKMEVKAWDTYNNFSSQTIDFNVKSNSDFALESIYNYPNPMQDFTNFVFQHNFDSPLTADIKIYTVSGRLIKELNKTNITDKFVNIDWDGTDTDGDIISNGTYIYKIIIKTEDGNFSKSSSGKLAKLK